MWTPRGHRVGTFPPYAAGMAFDGLIYEAWRRQSQVKLGLKDGREFEGRIARLKDTYKVVISTAEGEVEVSQLQIRALSVK